MAAVNAPTSVAPVAGSSMDDLARKLLSRSDLFAVFAVVIVVVMMIVPLPTGLISILVTMNIAGALIIIAASMYVKRALDFAAFPALLLLTTLFRLAINVSVTRLVLSEGDAGSVIHAFGTFVVGENVVVGLVVFLILVIIQFVVITNGAGRVAEVAARFTLDAMPGKQMSIDADLNAGQITEDEARQRRLEISREADFYGAMDGASKFVKGDAVASVIIVTINLVGGIVVGVMQQGMSFSESIQHFSLLTIGDGLAAQIPALLISTATGILVTRSASTADLGREITSQVLGTPIAPVIAGSVIFTMGLVPGLPKIPFFLVGGALILIGRAVKRHDKEDADKVAVAASAAEEARPVSSSDAAFDALVVDPLELAIGFGLVPMADKTRGGGLLARVGVIRKQIASEFGIVIAPVRIYDDVSLESHEYVIKVRGNEAARWRVIAGHRLAMNTGDAMPGLAGIPTVEPAFGLPAVWIEESAQAEADALGYTVVDAESVIVTHLTETIRSNAADLLTREETKRLLDALKERNTAAVEDVVPDKVGLGEVQRVLQNLLREGVSVRDLGSILEAIGDRAATTRETPALVEAARQALARSITGSYLDEERILPAISFGPGVEQEVLESLAQTSDGERLAMEPARAEALLAALGREIEKVTHLGRRPVMLCSSRIRRHVRTLVEQAFPQLPVISYSEVLPGIPVKSYGTVTG
ncbi:MAG TPA: flagellar biosynthesis protein FlhA [Gaiellaceae bacterium]|jgi:flagellar biosynthesis protein FlhA|nr:flagellar biosynthesis protein FlhA [Gaiellaceae bacterium]